MTKNKGQNESLLRTIGLWIRDIAICFIIAWLFISYIAQIVYVEGDSMNPTLQDGDYIIINKFINHFKDPQYNDIVVFPYNNNHDDPFIKRIIGLPGDEVDIHDGQVFINGKALVETYIIGPVEATDVEFPITIPDDQYFVMGDNRGVSLDSRFSKVGTIPRDNIIGKAGIRIWPLNEFGFIN